MIQQIVKLPGRALNRVPSDENVRCCMSVDIHISFSTFKATPTQVLSALEINMKEVFVYVVESYFKNFVIGRKYFLNFSQQTFTYIRMLYKEL